MKMMETFTLDLAGLITDSRGFLERFDYDDYPADLSSFEEKARPFFESLAGRDPEEAARELIDALQEMHSGLKRKMAAEAAREEKKVLALYLGPAARRFGKEALPFVETLQQKWNNLYPRNSFIPGDYDAIMKGFDATLIGIKLRKTKKRR